MNKKQAEERLKKLFGQVEDDDYSAIEEFIEENDGDCDLDLAEIAFRFAVINGYEEYVIEHADDVDLNDDDGYSTYLYDASDSEMEAILLDLGAFRSWDDYDSYSIAIESINWTVLSFTKEFQREVYEEFLKLSGLSEDDVIAFLNNKMDEEPKFPEALEDYDLEMVCNILKIELKDGGISLGEYSYVEDECGLKGFIEALGWIFDFEGETWRFETNGVYFINE